MYHIGVIISLLFLAICEINGSDVAFVATVFRHGDRTPISFYPNDPWSDRKWWPVGFGQLTEKGMLQHYKLGVKYRELYGHLLSNSYDSQEIYIRSTDYDRTIMSALSNLAGIYQVNSSDEFIPGMSWKPVPVRAIPKEIDDILDMTAPCPKFDWENNKFQNSKFYQDLYIEFLPIFQYLTHHTGTYINTFTRASYIYDVLFIEDSYNYTLPNWTAAVYPEVLKNISKYSFQFETYTPEMKRLKGGPIIKQILQFMDGTINNDSTYRFAMYSAHDTTIASILNSLGMFELQLPPYAAHLVFELIIPDEAIPEHKIRIKYEDEVLEIPNCGAICPLSHFKQLYKWIVPSDRESDCELRRYETNHWKVFGYIISLLVVFCLICVAVVLLRTEDNSKYLPCHDTHLKVANHTDTKVEK